MEKSLYQQSQEIERDDSNKNYVDFLLQHLDDVLCRYSIANCYYWGTCFKADREKAHKLFEECRNDLFEIAKNGDRDAQSIIAGCYYYGEFLEKDDIKAVYWLKQSAINGCADAQCSLGLCYQNGVGVERNLERAFELFCESAERGDCFAMIELAQCYEYGDGVKEDEEKAVYWLMQAAEKNYIGAYMPLGEHYLRGIGIEKDYEKAIEYFLLAEQDNCVATAVIAEMYYFGVGTEQDTKKAVEYLKIAIDTFGYEEYANCLLADCYFYGDGVEQDYKKAFDLYLRPAYNGNKRAIAQVAWCFLRGFGVEQNTKIAKHWYDEYENAIGDEKAYFNTWLNDLDVENEIVNKKIFEHISKSAIDGDKIALRVLAWCYKTGFCVEEDPSMELKLKKDCQQAAILMEGAVEEGDRIAMMKVVECYENGIGVEQNDENAKYWLKKSREGFDGDGDLD